jgi:hypothetical protein
MMDCVRKNYPPGPKGPIGVWVENGAPYTEATSHEITPAELKWAVWSTIVHGARGIFYFNHTFSGPRQTANNLNSDAYGGPGVTGTGIYAATKEINLLALSLAPAINSPWDGYLCFGDGSQSFEQTGFLVSATSTNARSYYAGVDVSCRWQPTAGKHYVFATTRESGSATNVPLTVRMVDQGQTEAHDMVSGSDRPVSRGGAIPGGFCEFTDTFSSARDIRVWRID